MHKSHIAGFAFNVKQSVAPAEQDNPSTAGVNPAEQVKTVQFDKHVRQLGIVVQRIQVFDGLSQNQSELQVAHTVLSVLLRVTQFVGGVTQEKPST